MSGGYTVLFSSLTTGTLCGRWPDVGLWPVILSMSDRHGVVDVTHAYIATVTGLSVEDVKACMQRFCGPDPGSRTPDHDGARLVLLDPDNRDWGWRIVNHAKYRERARKKEWDAANAGTDKGAAQRKAAQRIKQGASEFHRQVIECYHATLPSLPRVKSWTKRRAQALDARISERKNEGKPADTLDYWTSFFESVARSDFLCGRSTAFRADLEWLLRPENFLKVIEGRYSRGGNDGPR